MAMTWLFRLFEPNNRWCSFLALLVLLVVNTSKYYLLLEDGCSFLALLVVNTSKYYLLIGGNGKKATPTLFLVQFTQNTLSPLPSRLSTFLIYVLFTKFSEQMDSWYWTYVKIAWWYKTYTCYTRNCQGKNEGLRASTSNIKNIHRYIFNYESRHISFLKYQELNLNKNGIQNQRIKNIIFNKGKNKPIIWHF